MHWKQAARTAIVGVSRPADTLAGWSGRRRVHYVLPPSNWVFGEIERGLSRHMGELGRLAPRRSHFPWLARGQVLHFADRYQLLLGPVSLLSPSNHVIVTWFHGEPDDRNPRMRMACDRLMALQPRIQTILVSCEATCRTLTRLGVDPAKLVLIPLGVERDWFAPVDAMGRAEAKRRLGLDLTLPTLGSFQRDGAGSGDGMAPKLIKGPDVLLGVAERLKRAGERFQVLLTGPSRGYVKAGLDRLGVPYAHHYLQHYRDIGACYHALDAYLIGSRCEGGPMSLLECWASGVPVVSTRMGMPADLVCHGGNGYLAEVDDMDALAGWVGQLLGSPEPGARLADAGLAQVAAYGWDRIARRYWHELYEPCLAAMGQPVAERS